MELKQLQFKKIITYGSLGAIISSILFFILTSTDKNALIINSRFPFDFILFPVIIFMCLFDIKGNYKNKLISFRESLFSGTLVYLIITLVSGLALYFILSSQPEIVEGYIEASIKNVEANSERAIKELGETKETLALTINKLKEVTTIDIIKDLLVRKVTIGFFCALLISMFMRKKQNPNP